MQSITSWDFTAPGAGEWKPTGGGTVMSAIATLAGSGAVSGTFVVEVTNSQADPNGAVLLFTLSPNGNGGANDAASAMASWPWARARCTAISGTGAKGQVSLSVGG